MSEDVLLSQDREVLRKETTRLGAEQQEIEAGLREIEVALEQRRAGREAEVNQRSAKNSSLRTIMVVGSLAGIIALVVVITSRVRSFDEVHLLGQVTSATETAPSELNDACTIWISPEFFPYNAYIEVKCGGQMLYGRDPSGYAQCDTEGSRPTHCTDDGPIHFDGDPSIAYDRATKTFELSDESNWSMVITHE